MSITEELRAYTKHYSVAGSKKDTMLSSIADRIDAEHQKAEDEWRAKNGDTWLKGYAACHEELMEGHPVIAADLEKAGWVRLPVDAHGETIHVRDVLDGYGKTIEVVEMRYGRSGWVLISRDGNGYADTFAFAHHHAPTVEDVLREFAEGLGVPVADSYIAASAAKLRLAGDAE